jgi:hypothetical protein
LLLLLPLLKLLLLVELLLPLVAEGVWRQAWGGGTGLVRCACALLRGVQVCV